MPPHLIMKDSGKDEDIERLVSAKYRFWILRARAGEKH